MFFLVKGQAYLSLFVWCIHWTKQPDLHVLQILWICIFYFSLHLKDVKLFNRENTAIFACFLYSDLIKIFSACIKDQKISCRNFLKMHDLNFLFIASDDTNHSIVWCRDGWTDWHPVQGGVFYSQSVNTTETGISSGLMSLMARDRL